VVEGESNLSQAAQICLQQSGYVVRVLSSEDVMVEAEKSHPSLLLISLPEGSGLILCRQLRESPRLSRTPLLVLAADAREEHRILALEAGADDCIAKPFSPRELVARVQALLRRGAPAVPLPRPQTADLLIDSWAMKVSVRGHEIPTTSLEFRLIEYLARHAGQVFTRDLLLDAVWGDMQFVTPRSVDACIRRIRAKIEPDREKPTFLKTIRGVGYRLDAAAAWQSPSNEACDCVACTTAESASRLILADPGRRRRNPARI